MLPYVISSRVRLARNLKEHRLPQGASEQERRVIAERLCQIARAEPRLRDAECVAIDALPPLERRVLAEAYLISHHFASQGSSRVLVAQNATGTSVLVNEEDHLRIQSVCPGLQLQTAWRRAREMELSLTAHLDVARVGPDRYVTACPGNAGLGMRASVLLFVPGLIMLKRITAVIRQGVAAGGTLRGDYGEGSASQGYRLQLSNQRSDERNAIRLLNGVQRMCDWIMRQEQQARIDLLRHAAPQVRQELERARWRLVRAHALDVAAGMQILGLLRLGVCLETLSTAARREHHALRRLDRLCIEIQPAHLRQYALRRAYAAGVQGRDRDADSLDALRARLMRRSLALDNDNESEVPRTSGFRGYARTE